jgi:23S rRNA (adenine2503-C2)-methyltransferase
LSIPSLWQVLTSEKLEGAQRKARWDWLRHGIIPDPVIYGAAPSVASTAEGVHAPDIPNNVPCNSLQGHWHIAQRLVAADAPLTKIVLHSNEFQDACETVVMRPRPARGTVCVSTQVGCGVGCTFCATGRMGLQRQLSATEILEQVLVAKTVLRNWCIATGDTIHLRNVVLMGMGEPLHNDIAVGEAIDFMVADHGFGFSPRHITLSTVGVPEKMVAMARRFPRLRIALSLHAANSELRRQLVPRATNDLEALKQAIREINRIDPEEPVWIEVALIAGVNDSDEHARELIRFCDGLRVEINVIPYNNTSHAEVLVPSRILGVASDYAPPDRPSARWFVQQLRDAGFFTTLRNTLGQSVQAACGQLIAVRSGNHQ